MTRILIATALAAVVPLAAADAEHPRHPPKAAIDACVNAKAGDACSFTARGHAIDGTCESPPGETALACRPDHPPPPPEAIAACASAKAGDACSFSVDDHSITGVCDAPPGESTLACRPDHPPRR
jgi:hypothetical protein